MCVLQMIVVCAFPGFILQRLQFELVNKHTKNQFGDLRPFKRSSRGNVGDVFITVAFAITKSSPSSFGDTAMYIKVSGHSSGHSLFSFQLASAALAAGTICGQLGRAKRAKPESTNVNSPLVQSCPFFPILSKSHPKSKCGTHWAQRLMPTTRHEELPWLQHYCMQNGTQPQQRASLSQVLADVLAD